MKHIQHWLAASLRSWICRSPSSPNSHYRQKKQKNEREEKNEIFESIRDPPRTRVTNRWKSANHILPLSLPPSLAHLTTLLYLSQLPFTLSSQQKDMSLSKFPLHLSSLSHMCALFLLSSLWVETRQREEEMGNMSANSPLPSPPFHVSSLSLFSVAL